MMDFIADDFAAIRARMTEIGNDNTVISDDGTCPKCEGGGWTMYGLGHGDPHFRVCEECGNPNGNPSP